MPSPADQVFGPADQQTWTSVDDYVSDRLSPHDEALEQAITGAVDAGLPAIQVSPPQGKLLALLARSIGARTVLEFGTLGGYSTIWMARGLAPGGRLITLEADPRHAALARQNIAGAGVQDVVEVRVGKALEALPTLASEGAGPFDLIFIDADKANTPAYFTWALKLAHRGTLIVVDNVVRKGAVADPATHDADVKGMQRFFEMAGAERRVTATAIQTVGSKGYDGFSVVLVNA
jgi:predicted O-methyltransferase YrrM